MKKTPTLLMKELKFYREEITRLYKEDAERSYAPVNADMEYKYDTGYSYEKNRKKIREINEEEMKIRSALSKFNATTKVDGIDMTISEALVKISQLKDEVKQLMGLASRQEVFNEEHYGAAPITNKIIYNQVVVKEDLRKAQKELANIQIAVDRINLTALVEY